MTVKRRCLSQEEIRAYTHGTLSPQNQHDIEKHLLDCALCSSAVDYFQQEEDGISNTDEQQIASLKKELAALCAPSIRPLHTRGVNRWAAILLLALCAYAAYRYQQSTQTDRLVNAYLDELPDQPSMLRGETEAELPQSEERRQAMAFFQNADYESSIPHFENHLAQFTTDWQSRLLLGKAQLRVGKYSQALQTLRQVNTEEEQMLEEAHWLQVMALLQMNEAEAARPILQMLSQNINGAFQQESTQLMDRLY